jgi:hypothetical protein
MQTKKIPSQEFLNTPTKNRPLNKNSNKNNSLNLLNSPEPQKFIKRNSEWIHENTNQDSNLITLFKVINLTGYDLEVRSSDTNFNLNAKNNSNNSNLKNKN